MGPSVVATWDFSEKGVHAAAEVLKGAGRSADAVEEGVRVLELDPEVPTVGYGGLPSIDGTMQLDAGFMTGQGDCGAVMALQGYKSAVGIARRVMQQSRHTVLAGHGARQFAESIGFPSEPNEALLTEYAARRVAEEQAGMKRDEGAVHTDTVGFICLDDQGDITVACATSGMQFKAPGRVGDSPLIGAGLFADQAIGAATATGDGDQMIRFCLSFLVVELMRMGESPAAACEKAIRRVLEQSPECQAGVTAMNMRGEVGSSCTRSGYKTCSWTPQNGFKLDVHNFEGRPNWKRKCI